MTLGFKGLIIVSFSSHVKYSRIALYDAMDRDGCRYDNRTAAAAAAAAAAAGNEQLTTTMPTAPRPSHMPVLPKNWFGPDLYKLINNSLVCQFCILDVTAARLDVQDAVQC